MLPLHHCKILFAYVTLTLPARCITVSRIYTLSLWLYVCLSDYLYLSIYLSIYLILYFLPDTEPHIGKRATLKLISPTTLNSQLLNIICQYIPLHYHCCNFCALELELSWVNTLIRLNKLSLARIFLVGINPSRLFLNSNERLQHQNRSYFCVCGMF